MEQRRVLRIILLLLLVLLAVDFNPNIMEVWADSTIFVDDDNIAGPWDGTEQHPYQNITSAMNQAAMGNTIFVRNGSYYERLLINKSISLIGESQYGTILDANRTGTIIEIHSSNVTIMNFTLRNSGFFHHQLAGILLQDANNCTITFSTLHYCYKGIRSVNATHLNLLGNNIRDTLEGIYLINCNDSRISANTISDNEFGIVISDSTNNTLFHNNFINNTIAISSSINSSNYWNSNNEGNYWSTYAGVDIDHNGIGDTPHIMDPRNQDLYPLMGAFSSFTTIYENRMYHIPIICNSTLHDYDFNETLRVVRLDLKGINNTLGFCRTVIPNELICKPHLILVNGIQVNASSLPQTNETHTYLYVNYNNTISFGLAIFSKSHFELYTKFTNLLENMLNLNASFNQLSAEYIALNAAYHNLLAEFVALNTTYYKLLVEHLIVNTTYYELLTEYIALNTTYYELLAEHIVLNTTYYELFTEFIALNTTFNELYDELNASHTELLSQYESVNSSYTMVLTSYTKLQTDYLSLERIFSPLLVGSLILAGLTFIFSSLSLKYFRRSQQQKNVIKKYKRELSRLSTLDIARVLFESDVGRRKGKLEKFEKKYGVKIRPHNTLTEAIKSLELKKQEEAS